MKLSLIVGARPQFIKAAAIIRVLPENYSYVLIHTGQHYDANLSEVFFEELAIPKPDINLGVGSGTHGAQTGEMLTKLEDVLLKSRPDWVVVFGDTNSTLAGALAAAKLGVKVAHIEAGLRSYNRRMPEEINRILCDHISDLLLCPSQEAVDNLAREGIYHGVHYVGDVMNEVMNAAKEAAREKSTILDRLMLRKKDYILVTLHRAENTDDIERLRSIIDALKLIKESIIFPIHPRTRKVLEEQGLMDGLASENLRMLPPMGYLDMVRLGTSAKLIITDSGGLQKEAYWLGIPCITTRDETEWVETVNNGWNILVGAKTIDILNAVSDFSPPKERPPLYGDGDAALRCVKIITEYSLNKPQIERYPK